MSSSSIVVSVCRAETALSSSGSSSPKMGFRFAGAGLNDPSLFLLGRLRPSLREVMAETWMSLMLESNLETSTLKIVVIDVLHKRG